MRKIINVRNAEIRDIESMVELLKSLFSIEEDFVFDAQKQRDGLEMMLRDGDRRRVFVAEVEERVAGMASGQTMVSTAEGGLSVLVEDVIVDEKYRRLGVGKELLKNVESWAVEKGAKRLQLLADTGNFSALDFYKTLGWETTKLVCLQKKDI